MTVTLYGRSSSANVQKVVWALNEVGVAYEHIQLGGKYGGNRAPDYLALNPNGLVPTLKDGELVVWESNAIVRYLGAEYGAGTLWPEQPRVRALCDQWTDWAATQFQPAWIEVFWRLVRTAPPQRNPEAIAQAVAATERCFDLLDAQLARTAFVAGPQLTYADIVIGVAMFRWSTMDVTRTAHPHVEAWHERLRSREAFRTGVEVDYSELAAG